MKLSIDRSVRLVLGFVVLSGLLSGRAYCAGEYEILYTTSHVSGASSRATSIHTSDLSTDDKSAFVESRFAAIRYDAARGYGENLDTLATLLGEPDRAEFARWMKAHYSDLFVGLDAPSELLVRLETQRSRG